MTDRVFVLYVYIVRSLPSVVFSAHHLTRYCPQQEDTFYWCLNPNSGDTGGLLDYDFTTPMTDKLKLLDRVQPNPTLISSKGEGQLCIAPGAYANPKCDKGRRLVRA